MTSCVLCGSYHWSRGWAESDKTTRGKPGRKNGADMQLMTQSFSKTLGLMAFLLLTACENSGMDWDLRSDRLDTTSAAASARDVRPTPDSRGVISYPTYQVVVAKPGDTVATVAERVGLSAGEMASFNALSPTDTLRGGEVLALPARVSAASATTSSVVDVSAIAATALDRVDSSGPITAQTIGSRKPSAEEPLRHQVKRGETAFTIARTYNVSAKALADWNGLGSDLVVREGQYLIIPTGSGAAPSVAAAEETIAAPGVGSPTPQPPSASAPLPDEKTLPAAEAEPASPNLEDTRTAASAAQFAMPVDGKIIRPYSKGKNDGIDIAAPAGTAVKAAAAGSVAAITTDTSGTPIIVLRHDGGLLTVYAGVDAVTIKKGDTVSRGQSIAKVKAGDPAFLHFEVRQGADSADPMAYLQ
jgi:murein DD-endopeptidase MepM/ murein hydrolase activator NlpD